MLPIVYIESSVIGYLSSYPSTDIIAASRQAISRDWWENHRHRFDVRISTLVYSEISRGDPLAAKRRLNFIEGVPLLGVSEQAIDIAEMLILKNGVPRGSEDDAMHIGIAATQGVAYLLTWNFKHINNAETKSTIIDIVTSFGVICPSLCSPEELGGCKNDR